MQDVSIERHFTHVGAHVDCAKLRHAGLDLIVLFLRDTDINGDIASALILCHLCHPTSGQHVPKFVISVCDNKCPCKDVRAKKYSPDTANRAGLCSSLADMSAGLPASFVQMGYR